MAWLAAVTGVHFDGGIPIAGGPVDLADLLVVGERVDLGIPGVEVGVVIGKSVGDVAYRRPRSFVGSRPHPQWLSRRCPDGRWNDAGVSGGVERSRQDVSGGGNDG